MIDVCQFINSRDIADYLREIDYQFTAPEAAFIVYWSRDATLDERFDAWLEIAETMPDCSMEKRLNMKPIPSFRSFLNDYVDQKKRELVRFFEPSVYVYSYSYYEDGYEQDGNLFSDAEGCIAYAKEYWGESCWNEDVIPRSYRLEKRPIDQPDSCRDSELYLNSNMKIVSVYSAEKSETETDLNLQFDGMWFAFPTPFKRGDIVVDARMRKPAPFVLNYLSSWRRDDFLANGFDEDDRIVDHCDHMFEHHLAEGDYTDMEAYGFGVGETHSSSGSRVWGDVVYRDCMCVNHLDLEYFRGELADSDRWAAVVSAHIKGEIGFDEAANFLYYLKTDAETRQLRGILDAWYPEEYYPDGVWKRIRREGKWTR